MTQIKVKDSEWYREAFDMPKRIHVYIGETRAEHKARKAREQAKNEDDRYYGYSGYDEFNDQPDRLWDHE